MIEENIDLIKQYFGDEDHALTMAALESIHDRYQKHSTSSTSGSSNSTHWLNPFASGEGEGEGVEIDMQPSLIWFGDDRPEKDMVYAVGVDPIRKRVTVAFRGSVTPSDFLTDASITLNRQENVVFPDQDKIGIHNGFYGYLLKERKGGENKFQEIMKHVSELFEDSERQQTYRLYVTGHSLGGALATLFSFYAAASDDYNIPKPVTCVSVASPRVGEGLFQQAFTSLEEQGKLRHLRIVNDGDPVTLMPTSSSKKLWAMLSPISYVAFKISDSEFEKRETYKHTGIKLKMKKHKDGEKSCDIAYSGGAKEERSDVSSGSKSRLSFRQKDLPGARNHFGNVYCDNLAGVKDEISGISLNDLYLNKAAATVSAVDSTEPS